MRAGIEHGGGDDVTEEAWTLAYYYLNPKPSAILTDSLDIGNTTSGTAHLYAADSQSWTGSLTNTFEGAFQNVSITHTGRADKGCSFTMAILPGNNGVILRRMFDQNNRPQQASVSVDDSLVGTWYYAGSNTSHRWREDEFMVPASLTKGKNHIQVQLHHAAGSPDWNEYKYWVYTLTDTATVAVINPHPGNHSAISSTIPSGVCQVIIFSLDGKMLQTMHIDRASLDNHPEHLLSRGLPKGIYLIKEKSGAVILSRKIIW
jgi:hypothetical protein